MSRSAPEVTARKWGGDDRYSWAVFVRGREEPVVTGLMKSELRFHMEQVQKIIDERRRSQNGST